MRITGRNISQLLAVIFILVIGTPTVWAQASSDEITCNRPTGPTLELGQAKLFFEHNSTDQDTGVHGAFDTSSFAELCVYNPSGRQILAVKPQRKLLKLTMGGIFFESREPPNAEVSLNSLMTDFPEGLYTIRGVSIDGTGLSGAATLTHDIPAAPIIVFPEDEAVVAPRNLRIKWKAVTRSLSGSALKPKGYEVIITKDVRDDPNGFSRPTFDVHVLPSRTSLDVPNQFLEPSTPYELEILVLEKSGNQTIAAIHFETGN